LTINDGGLPVVQQAPGQGFIQMLWFSGDGGTTLLLDGGTSVATAYYSQGYPTPRGMATAPFVNSIEVYCFPVTQAASAGSVNATVFLQSSLDNVNWSLPTSATVLVIDAGSFLAAASSSIGSLGSVGQIGTLGLAVNYFRVGVENEGSDGGYIFCQIPNP
jgi:hypothetical protein